MVLPCRAVEREKVSCPSCAKQLTLKTLQYKHAQTCKPLVDRIRLRTQAAQDIYEKYGGTSLVGTAPDTDRRKPPDAARERTAQGTPESNNGNSQLQKLGQPLERTTWGTQGTQKEQTYLDSGDDNSEGTGVSTRDGEKLADNCQESGRTVWGTQK